MKWLIQQCAKLAGQRNAVKLLRAHAVTKNILKYGDPHFFQQVFIEINGHCNRTCRYCPNSVEALPESFMSLDRFDTILRRLREINWTGLVAYHYLNEPLLHPHLCGFIRQTIRLLPKSKPVLFTNGDFLTPKMAENLIDSGLYRCTITRHVPVTKEWDERIPAIIKSNPEVFRMNIIRLGGMMNPAGIMKPNAANKWLQKNVNYCVSPTRVFGIRLNGDVSVCHCDFKGESHGLGNVLTQTIMDIWDSPEFGAIRSRLRNGDKVYKMCENCTGVA